jgi:hypothetical protein
MSTILENVNEIIKIKNELKNILIAVGVEVGDDFSTYPDLFRMALIQIQNISEDIL